MSETQKTYTPAQKKYYQANADLIKQKSKQYYELNKDIIKIKRDIKRNTKK